METLPVPYVSQIGEGASARKNDCGAAAGLMLLKAYQPETPLTVDEFYRLASNGSNQDRYLTNVELRLALAKHGVQVLWRTGVKLWQVWEALSEGRPGIALINYGVLVRAGLTQRTDFWGAHFIVCVGVDIKNIAIHDPYRDDGKGESVLIPIKKFSEAWLRVNEINNTPAFGWLGCRQPMEAK